MGRAIIVLGDTTNHGGTVITASGTAQTDGKAIACVGDKVRCPRHGVKAIVSGDATMLIDGKPVARHGDSIECGATLVSQQMLTNIG